MGLRRLLLTSSCLLLAQLAFSSVAWAGTYQVQSCNDGNHGGSNVWSYFSNNGNFINWGDGCSGGGLIQSWGGTSDAPQGAAAGRFLDAPSGTSFSYLFWQQSLTMQGGGYRCVYATDAGGSLIGSSNCLGNSFSEQSTGWVNQSGGLNSSRIYLYTACFGGPCTGGSSNRLIGQFGYANANITDQTSPGLYGLGGVWGRGWVRGNWPISWNASDSLGMKSHAYQVDGATQASYGFCSIGSFASGYYYGSSMQPCPNPGQGGYQSASFNVATTSYGDGTHSLSAVSYDATDNAGSAAMTLYVDNSSPSLVAFSGGPPNGGWTNDPTPTFSLAASDPQSGIGGYQCQVDGGAYYGCSSPVTLSPLSEGQHQLCARAYNQSFDTGGNPAFGPPGCTTFSVDTIPPSADLEQPGPWIAASGTKLYGTASDPISGLASVRFEARPQSGGSFVTLCQVAGSATQPFECSVDGSSLTNNQTYELRLTAVNKAGSSASSTIYTSQVDNQPPSSPSVTAGPADGSWVATTSATYTFSSTDPVSGVAAYQCKQGSAAWASCTSPETFSALALGMNSISLKAIDNAGNVSSPTSRQVGSDTVPPTLDLNVLPSFISGTVTVSGTATDSLSGVDNSSVRFQSRETTGGSWVDICAVASRVGSDYSCSWDVSALSGSYQVRMLGEDNVGNQPASWPSDSTTIANQSPVVTLTDSGRVDDWTVTASPAGVDPNQFEADYSLDSGGSWQPMDDAHWIAPSDTYRAAVPDSVPGGTPVEVRLRARTNAGVEGSLISSYTIPLSPPVNTAPPLVSGEAQVGQQLASTDGDWSGLPPITVGLSWLRCDSAGEDCQRLAATGPSYTQVDADAGNTIRSLALANNPDGEANTESSDFAGPVAALPPTPVAPPAISGTPEDGQTASATTGSWSGTPPFDYSYQWQRCAGSSCVDIPAATEAAYEAVSADVGRTIKVQVTASNASLPGGGSASQASSDWGPVQAVSPANTALPVITGLAYDGQAMTVSSGEWSGSTPFDYTYQWKACNSSGTSCSDLGGEIAQSIEVPVSAIGGTLRAQVTASNAGLPGGGSASATSDASPVIEQASPQNTGLPVVSGNEQEGSQLSSSSGSWDGLSPINFAYQWQRCDASGLNCQNIAGATAGAYLLEGADVGSVLQVVVTASNAAGQLSVTSQQTGVIAVLPDPPSNTSAPIISGSAEVGELLSASPGSWVGHTPISYSYQWQRCSLGECSDITGANSQGYTTTGADASKQLRVQVTATNSYGSSSQDSAQTTSIVSLVPVNDVSPHISGSAQVGDKLSADPGSWNADPQPVFSYTWLACSSSGQNCDQVGTGTSYTPSNSDQGRYLVLSVSASNVHGTTVSKSAPLGPVAPAPQPPKEVDPPRISGPTQVGNQLTTTPGDWQASGVVFYQYQWLRCRDDSLSSCLPIQWATERAYTLSNADLGWRLRVLVVATDEGGTSDAYASATTKIAAPACVKASGIAAGTIRAGSLRVRFSGASAGYAGGSKAITVKASASRKVKFRWLLNNRPLTSRNAKSSRISIPNSRLLIGKSNLTLEVRSGSTRRSLSRTVTTSACPLARKLSPKPKSLSTRIGSRRFKASISQLYKVLSPGRFRVSGPSGSLRWRIDNKTISSRRSVSVSPSRIAPGSRVISLRITSGGRSRTLTWRVDASDYPN